MYLEVKKNIEFLLGLLLRFSFKFSFNVFFRVLIRVLGDFVKFLKDGFFWYSMVFFYGVIYSNMCYFDNTSSSNDILEDAQSTLIYVCGNNCGHQHIGIVQYK